MEVIYGVKNVKVYALYKGDEFIDLGTLDELQRSTGKSREYLTYLKTPANERRVRKRTIKTGIDNNLILIPCEEDL